MLSPIRSHCFVIRPTVLPEGFPVPSRPAAPQAPAQPAAPREDWLLTLAKYTPGPTLAIPAGLAFWTRVVPQVASHMAQDVQTIGQGIAQTARDVWQGLTGVWNTLASAFGPAAPTPGPLLPPAPKEPVALPRIGPADVFDRVAETLERATQPADARELRRMFRGVVGRDASDAEIEEGQRRLQEGMTRTGLRQHWSQTPEARIGRIFEQETGQPINDMGRGYWLNEYRNGQSYGEIRTRLADHMAYLKEKGYAS